MRTVNWWYVCHANDNGLPDISVFGEHQHVAVHVVYLDDFLANPHPMLQPLLQHLLKSGRVARLTFSDENLEVLIPCDSLAWILSWDTIWVLGLFTDKATSMRFCTRCMTLIGSLHARPKAVESTAHRFHARGLEPCQNAMHPLT